MSFLSGAELIGLLPSCISDFQKERIQGDVSYELSLGSEVYLTDSKDGKKELLTDEDPQVVIKPGQFALLLTHEMVTIPKDKIAFISIKFSEKIKGLVNVSGFHVDPGYSGKIIFSVYNAGPREILLDKGAAYFPVQEQLPRCFTAIFREVGDHKVQVKLNGIQIGDIINDNSTEPDYYRYHDIFHYTFATMLGWSPCMRAMLKKKRKSSPLIDSIEDGARATITEEAISLMLFNEAKRKNFFKNDIRINKSTLTIIKEMTESFEVGNRSKHEWEKAILKGYEMFRLLTKNKGGEIHFDLNTREINYLSGTA